jgi:hypothetical protein
MRLLTRAAVVLAVLSVPLAGSVARAAEADADGVSAASLRAQADAIAGRYFDALARYQTLDRQITDARAELKVLAARARQARADARARSISAYRGAAAQLPSIVDSTDAIGAARRLLLLDQVNARTREVYSRLRTATKELTTRRRALENDRTRQADALARLQADGATMDAKLALAQQRERAALAAQQAVAAAAPAQAEQPLAAPTPSTTVAPAAPTAPSAPPPAPAPPPDYSGTPGTHPMHDDPFLTCVRARESGGRYDVVNPAGPYLGAYQFLQSTWNATANHAGRRELVGVPANRATPYDQDDMAWTLYQWQGMGPWGGACP